MASVGNAIGDNLTQYQKKSRQISPPTALQSAPTLVHNIGEQVSSRTLQKPNRAPSIPCTSSHRPPRICTPRSYDSCYWQAFTEHKHTETPRPVSRLEGQHHGVGHFGAEVPSVGYN